MRVIRVSKRWVILGVLAIAILIACGVLGYALFEKVAGQVRGRSADPDMPAAWRAASGDGFAMYAPPGGLKVSDRTIKIGSDHRAGRRYDASGSLQHDLITVSMTHCTVGNTANKYSKHADLLHGFDPFSGDAREIGDRTVDGRDGKEFLKDRIAGQEYTWVAKVGDRVYFLRFEIASAPMDQVLVKRIREAWLRSVTIAYPADATSDSDADTAAWVTWKKAGCSVEIPKGTPTEQTEIHSLTEARDGRSFALDDDRCHYRICYHDGPVEKRGDPAAHVESLLRLGGGHKVVSSEEFVLGGKVATRWELKGFFGGPGYGVTVRSGDRLFSFFCTVETGIYMVPDPIHQARAERFLGSIKIDYDPKTFDPLADEPPWISVGKGGGYTVLMPAIAPAAPHGAGFGREAFAGKGYRCQKDNLVYEAYTYDLPPEKTLDALVTAHFNAVETIDGPTASRMDGKEATDYRVQDAFKRSIFVRAAQVGKRTIVLIVSPPVGFEKVLEADLLARKVRFFESFRFEADTK